MKAIAEAATSALVADLAEADPQESRQHDENAHCV
jgi:hypothetical protein